MGRCEDCPFSTPAIDNPEEIRQRDLLIIGEAPGRKEVRTGKPFVGPSGKLLWETLANIKVSREDCAITNALSCYIPDELYKKKGTAVKGPVQCCRGRLLKEIATVKPKVILTLGNVALHALTENFQLKITRERGRVFNFYYGLDGECLVLPTMHPAAMLRNPADYKKFRNDIAYLYRVLRGDVNDPGKTEWMVVPPEWIPDAIRFLSSFDRLHADIETTPDKTVGLLGIAYGPNSVLQFEGEENIKRLLPLFQNPNITWGWFNGKFDTKHLNRIGLPARFDEDSMLAHYVLDETKGTHDLSQLSTLHLGAPDYATTFKATLTDNSNFFSGPLEALCDYNARDCAYDWQLNDKFVPIIKAQPDLAKLYYDLLLPAARFLDRVEQHGIWINPEEIDNLQSKLETQLSEVLAEIYERASEFWDPVDYMMDTGAKSAEAVLNPGSWQQLQWLLYDAMGLRPRNGERNTERETLESIPEHPFVNALLKYRKLQKNLSTYVQGMRKNIGHDGRVHCSYLPHGTVTGRLSSREPNMQNIPKRAKDIRDIFQAPPGSIFVEVDLAQAELRVLAHFSQDPALMQVFLTGQDLHTDTALRIAKLVNREPDRTNAKRINFGICYGLTAFSLAESNGIPISEAQDMLDGWAQAYPMAWAYLQQQRELPIQGKFPQTPFGRRRRFPLITKEILNAIQNESANFAIQSTASDITLLMAMKAEEALGEFDAKIINLIHDSCLTETTPGMEKRVVRILNDSLNRVTADMLGSEVPFQLSATIGTKWGHLDAKRCNCGESEWNIIKDEWYCKECNTKEEVLSGVRS